MYCSKSLTVGLLEPGTGTTSTELLGLAAAGVGHQEGPVEVDEKGLDLLLLSLINVLLVVCNDSLGNSLADSVDLRGVTTTLHPDADVHNAEHVGAEEHERLH